MSLRDTGSKAVRALVSPPPFELTEALFLRLLGLVYLAAFASFLPQIVGLIGSQGIAPAQHFLSTMRAGLGAKAWWYFPSLFWFGINNSGLIWVCALGCVAALVLIAGYYSRIAAAICYILYLSLVTIGQPFTEFQWDALLLEAGFLALFAGVPWLVWAYRFLLFRLMFESGAVKLLSGDANWRNLHALRFHFMTQPLPNPIAYYAYRAPTWLLDSMTGATLFIELICPFLLFCPRRARQVGVILLIVLQLLIILTGNYAFFNLLALALCMWGFDDQTFAPLARALRRRVHPISRPVLRRILGIVLVVLIVIGAIQAVNMIAPRVGRPLSKLSNLVAPFEIVNTYGLFAVMTTARPEIVIEGSDDQVNWREYSFPYKPGPLHRGLPLIAPYQPRLDWQMWFAALGDYQENTWVGGLIYRLLTGERSVIRLMDSPPFTKPPRYMRAQLYDYTFTTPAVRKRTGAVWQRQLIRTWFGPVSLRQP